MIKKVTITQDELLGKYIIDLRDKPYRVGLQFCSEAPFGEYILAYDEIQLCDGDIENLQYSIKKVFTFSELQLGEIIFGNNEKFKLVQKEWSFDDHGNGSKPLLCLFFVPETKAVINN